MRNLVNEPNYAATVDEMEARLQRWIEETGDPFDSGERLPITEMLDLGQTFIDEKWYDLAPKEYAAAIANHDSDR